MYRHNLSADIWLGKRPSACQTNHARMRQYLAMSGACTCYMYVCTCTRQCTRLYCMYYSHVRKRMKRSPFLAYFASLSRRATLHSPYSRSGGPSRKRVAPVRGRPRRRPHAAYGRCRERPLRATGGQHCMRRREPTLACAA